MRQLKAFNFITLNGYYKGPGENIDWHHHGNGSGEENEYAASNLKGESTLVFGRVTYQMMASYWPTSLAMQQNPTVAEGMNKADKIVFSNTLQTADWHNTKLIKGDMIEEMKKLKQMPGNDMRILGSGNIISQLAAARLIDGYTIMIDPVAIGVGTSLFSGIDINIHFELVDSRVFKSGVVLLNYKAR